jgi:hypothetical protein
MEPRYERFTFLCTENERRAIAELATQLQRSQSDAVRFVVVEVVKQLTAINPATAEPSRDPKPQRAPKELVTA